MGFRDKITRLYFKSRLKAIEHFRRHPIEVQQEMFRQRVKEGAETSLGREYGITPKMTPEAFSSALPIFDYELFKPYVERMLSGEKSVASRGVVDRFAQSSGTTSDRSKYIPITMQSVKRNHSFGMQDVAALYQAAYPESRVLDGKILTLGGTCKFEGGNLIGDLSAITYKSTLPWNNLVCVPSQRIALMADFDEKCREISRHCSKMDIRAFAGVPSWNLELMRAVLDYTGKSNLREVWPHLECFVHGGVSFTPYREAFEELIPYEGMHYMETYNASEGFFAIADDKSRDDMLLMLDYGTYYEFRQGDSIVPLEGVKCGETYAMIITSNNGLWRYEMGDTVTFTSTDPFRIRFAGRTRQFLNVFGEELIVDNAERALSVACQRCGARVEEYTIAPRFMTLKEQGVHEWAVEFSRPPQDLEEFSNVLDEELRRINSDYDAKRKTALDRLVLHDVKRGVFYSWLRRRGKNKVPRMMSERGVLEEILRDNEK